MEAKFQVQLKIRKPVEQVFDAVVDPKTLQGYFVKASSGPLVPGTTVKWSFAEVPGDFDVVVHEVVRPSRIVFAWPAEEGGYNTRVEMAFKALEASSTMVQIAESGWRPTPAGVKSSYENAGGWMHMMCCMKALLEYGVNLRAGGAL